DGDGVAVGDADDLGSESPGGLYDDRQEGRLNYDD
ncbi:uncharacterized protein METZ01_LOCUS516443, partial [marine metagenome]